MKTTLSSADQDIQSAGWLAYAAYQRVISKLQSEPVEDNRVDFEDGYGNRPNAEEDMRTEQAAVAMAEAMGNKALLVPVFSFQMV